MPHLGFGGWYLAIIALVIAFGGGIATAASLNTSLVKVIGGTAGVVVGGAPDFGSAFSAGISTGGGGNSGTSAGSVFGNNGPRQGPRTRQAAPRNFQTAQQRRARRNAQLNAQRQPGQFTASRRGNR